jgi:molecular chaperone GrpE
VAEARRGEEKIIPMKNGGEEQAPESGSPSADSTASAGMDPASDTVLSAELAKLRAEKEDLLNTLVRRQADFENFRKRVERDRHEEGRRGVERLITDLIPILDAFDRALKTHDDPGFEEYRKGVNLIRKQLWDALSRHGVQRIDAAGKIFDPHVHQAIERAEAENYPDGYILEVFQDGYLFHGRVLRPAIVRVVVHSDAGQPSNPHSTEN